MAGGDVLSGWVQVLTLAALIIGILATLGLLWSRRDYLFRPRAVRERELHFKAAQDIIEKVVLDFAYANTYLTVSNQLELMALGDRLKRYALRPFLGSDLRTEMNRLRELVGAKLDLAARDLPLGESAWPENIIQWGRSDTPIVDQYLTVLARTADQLQISPGSFRDIKDHLLGVKQRLERIDIPGG